MRGNHESSMESISLVKVLMETRYAQHADSVE